MENIFMIPILQYFNVFNLKFMIHEYLNLMDTLLYFKEILNLVEYFYIFIILVFDRLC
jgi:hypothetical protein